VYCGREMFYLLCVLGCFGRVVVWRAGRLLLGCVVFVGTCGGAGLVFCFIYSVCWAALVGCGLASCETIVGVCGVFRYVWGCGVGLLFFILRVVG
jgi:hypothetical protein